MVTGGRREQADEKRSAQEGQWTTRRKRTRKTKKRQGRRKVLRRGRCLLTLLRQLEDEKQRVLASKPHLMQQTREQADWTQPWTPWAIGRHADAPPRHSHCSTADYPPTRATTQPTLAALDHSTPLPPSAYYSSHPPHHHPAWPLPGWPAWARAVARARPPGSW